MTTVRNGPPPGSQSHYPPMNLEDCRKIARLYHDTGETMGVGQALDWLIDNFSVVLESANQQIEDIAALHHRIEKLNERLRKHEETQRLADATAGDALIAAGALVQISRLGRTCPDFLTCDHGSCADSSHASILAADTLRAIFG